MTKSRKIQSRGRSAQIVVFMLICLSLVTAMLLHGANVEIFNPKGLIAQEQLKLMLRATIILLEIAIPALGLFYYTAWNYRETNLKVTLNADDQHNKSVVFAIWAFPTITMLLLASIMWPAAHRLAPQKAIASTVKPLTIQVVAMRWKWLFIYPEQGIATVNFAQVPVNTPIHFLLSADETPMSSFWIPQLAGQLYAMTGHVNQLNLMASTSGDYKGSSAEINGDGFAGMKFITRASTLQEFDTWVSSVKSTQKVLDTASYDQLLHPSENNLAAYYSHTTPGLYDTMLMKYMGPQSQHMEHE